MHKGVRIYGEMFWTFLKIGAFTLGGGYAMIPLIQGEVVEKKHWIDEEEFLNMLALAQSAPGVMAANAAIFIGYKMRGWKGVIATLLGSILPSFVAILLIATVFTRYRELPAVEAVFKGIRPAVVALIAAPLWKMLAPLTPPLKGEVKQKKSHWETAFLWLLLLIPVGVALLIWLCDISAIWIILLTIVAAVCITFFTERRRD